MNIYLGLVHYPVVNKRGEMVTTSVTNMDVHDISRSCKTYGVKKYYLITPLQLQHDLIERILMHWKQDKSCAYNPDRHSALAIAELSYSVEDTVRSIEKVEGKSPLLVVTTARDDSSSRSITDLKDRIKLDRCPCLLLFGTGWGLHASIMDRADLRLRSLRSEAGGDYNHLSVRSAVAIYLDRLCGGL